MDGPEICPDCHGYGFVESKSGHERSDSMMALNYGLAALARLTEPRPKVLATYSQTEQEPGKLFDLNI